MNQTDSNTNLAPRSKTRYFRPATVALAVTLFYLCVIFLINGDTMMEFITPRQTGAQGYDGQFTYHIALDPFGAPAIITQLNDFPAYRYQRMLHAYLARILSLGGQVALLPFAMLAIGLAAQFAGTLALEALLTELKVSRWHALTYGLFAGVAVAVRANTPEPLAFGLALLGVWAERRNKLTWQAILFALAALSKEPVLFFTAAYLTYFAVSGRWRDVLRLGVIGILPFVAWQLYVYSLTGAFGMGSGGGGATGFEIIPFFAIWRVITVETGHWYAMLATFGVHLILGTVIPTVYALLKTGQDLLQRRWHPYTFLLFFNAAIVPFTPFSTYREPFGIVRFMTGFVACFILYAALLSSRNRIRRPLRYASLFAIWGLIVVA